MGELCNYSDLKEMAKKHRIVRNDVINFIEEVIDPQDIKLVYPKKCNLQIFDELIIFTDSNIYIVDTKDGEPYTINALKMNDIKSIKIARLSRYKFQLNIEFNNGCSIFLSNEHDADEDWSENYNQYIKDIFKHLS